MKLPLNSPYRIDAPYNPALHSIDNDIHFKWHVMNDVLGWIRFYLERDEYDNLRLYYAAQAKAVKLELKYVLGENSEVIKFLEQATT